jgi:RNA polymerase sigma-70 factor (ECF subfamily)
LPAAEREVVALRYGADLTGPQIARVLGVPGTTVDGRLHRAMGHLRTLLGHEDERP